MFPLEVPVFSPHSASLAIAQHAARVELNRNGSYPEGGLTPTIADLASLVSISSSSAAPVRIMIRPRGPPPPHSPEGGKKRGAADFLYTDAEFDEMKSAIREFQTCGLMSLERGDGFVFGCLKEETPPSTRQQPQGQDEGGRGKDGKVKGERGDGVVVDVERNRELVALARPFPAVFHRAFDDIIGSKASSVDEALRDLQSCGFHGLLTSGGPGSAVNNRKAVAQILSAATAAASAGGLREVIVGGGVRSTNVDELKGSLLGAIPDAGGLQVWFHSSCLTRTGEGDVVEEEEVRGIVRALG